MYNVSADTFFLQITKMSMTLKNYDIFIHHIGIYLLHIMI